VWGLDSGLGTCIPLLTIIDHRKRLWLSVTSSHYLIRYLLVFIFLFIDWLMDVLSCDILDTTRSSSWLDKSGVVHLLTIHYLRTSMYWSIGFVIILVQYLSVGYACLDCIPHHRYAHCIAKSHEFVDWKRWQWCDSTQKRRLDIHIQVDVHYSSFKLFVTRVWMLL
jgi:hypothetical protein